MYQYLFHQDVRCRAPGLEEGLNSFRGCVMHLQVNAMTIDFIDNPLKHSIAHGNIGICPSFLVFLAPSTTLGSLSLFLRLFVFAYETKAISQHDPSRAKRYSWLFYDILRLSVGNNTVLCSGGIVCTLFCILYLCPVNTHCRSSVSGKCKASGCSLQPCLNDGKCTDLQHGDYKCDCRSGHSGFLVLWLIYFRLFCSFVIHF